MHGIPNECRGEKTSLNLLNVFITSSALELDSDQQQILGRRRPWFAVKLSGLLNL